MEGKGKLVSYSTASSAEPVQYDWKPGERFNGRFIAIK
jgi:hypothetical protein